jgi:hypothetical protein
MAAASRVEWQATNGSIVPRAIIGGMDARPWQFSIRQAMVATALVAGAAWFAHYTADGTEPFLRLAGLFIAPVLIGLAVGVVAGSIWSGLVWGVRCGYGLAIVILLWLVSHVGSAAWVARHVAIPSEPFLQLAGVLVVPMLLCAAVGKLCGQVKTGLWWGVRCDYCLIIAWLLWMLAVR